MYDTVIIGAGPAGLTALLYVLGYDLKACNIGSVVGGKFLHAPDALDYPGVVNLKGADFLENLQKQLEQKNPQIIQEIVTTIKNENNIFTITTNNGATYQSKTLIIATGNGKKERENEAEKLAKQLGVELNDGMIVVKELGNTSVRGVFAAGDCIAYPLVLEQLAVATASGIVAASGVYQHLKNEKSPILWGSSKIPRR